MFNILKRSLFLIACSVGEIMLTNFKMKVQLEVTVVKLVGSSIFNRYSDAQYHVNFDGV